MIHLDFQGSRGAQCFGSTVWWRWRGENRLFIFLYNIFIQDLYTYSTGGGGGGGGGNPEPRLESPPTLSVSL